MVRILCALVMFAGCASKSNDWHLVPQEHPPSFDREEPEAELAQILSDFVDDCTSYGADVSAVNKLEYIRYVDDVKPDSPDVVGICWTYSYGNTVHKSSITVERMEDPIVQKALVYHELGHCILGLPHTSQSPYTLMSPRISYAPFYEEHWDELVEQLCTMN